MTTRRTALDTVPVRPVERLRASVWTRPAAAFLQIRGYLGRRLSVRWKLTLWYALMCTVTIGLVGYGMQYILNVQTQQSIDSDVHSTGVTLTNRLSQLGDGPSVGPVNYETFKRSYARAVTSVLRENSYTLSKPSQFELVELLYLASFPNHFCILEAQTRRPCDDNSAVGGIAPTAEMAQILPAVAFSGRARTQELTVNGERVRAYFTPLQPPPTLRGKVIGVVEVFQSERNFEIIANRINLLLLFGIPLALATALGAGWWIARAALRPIDRISRTVRAVGESRDLSRRLRFVGPEDEVGRLAETFDGMMDRLESVFEAQKRFVADASHELRTPLTAIRGNADLAVMSPPEEQAVCIASIRREAERMSRLVSDLLLLAAADLEQRPVHMQMVPLEDLLRDVYRSALVMSNDKVSVSLDVDDQATIQADPDRIKQLMLNLVDNAIKFTPADGHVSIALASERGGVRITVTDTGLGIPEEDRRAIFERFYRVEQSRSTRGTGLGLAICAWIVQAHSGTIDLKTALGEGSSFVVHLPAHQPAA